MTNNMSYAAEQEYTKIHICFEFLAASRGFLIYSCEERLGGWNVFVKKGAEMLFEKLDADFNSVDQLL